MGTGDYKVKEYVVEDSVTTDPNLISTSNYSSGGTWTPYSGWTLQGGYIEKTSTSGGSCFLFNINKFPLTVGRRYRFTYTIQQETSGEGSLEIYHSTNASILNKTLGTHTYDFVENGNGDFRIYATNDISGLQISYMNIVELPPFDTGTKYLECTSDGTIKIPYNGQTDVDAKIDYYDGSSWERLEDTLADLITDNAWLSLSGGYLEFDLDAGEAITNIKITDGVIQ